MRTTHIVPAQRIVLVLGAGTAISLLGDSTLYTVLPRLDIATEAGVTLAMVGVLLGANRVIRLLTNGIAGVLYDRWPRRPLLIASLFAGALSTLIFAIARGPVPLLASRFLWGAAWSGIWVGGNAAVLDVALPENRGRLSGQYQMWFFLGTGGAALVGGVLTDLIGFHRALFTGAIMTFFAAGLWVLALPHARSGSGAGAPLPDARTVPPIAQPGSFPWSDAFFVAVPLFVTRFVFAGIASATTALWLAGLIGNDLPVARFLVPLATLTGIFVASRSLVSLVGARLAGAFSDSGGGRWRATAVVMAAGAAGVWAASSQAVLVAIAGGLLAAVSAGGVQAVVPAIAADTSDLAQRGRMLSVAFTMGDLGSALGPPLALGLVGALSIGTTYRLCAALLAFTVAFALWRSKHESVCAVAP